jgi:glycosyltransferase involved in cell wall biosynthesis
MGEQRRVRSWVETLGTAGFDMVVIGLTEEHPAGVAGAIGSVIAVARGRAVPEALAWRVSAVRARLVALRVDAIVCVSARAYHPSLIGAAPSLVLDYVDALSRSYADRGRLASTRRARAGYALLARAHRRFERSRVPGVRPVAAGYADALRLGATWVPIVATPCAPADAQPDADVLFVGTLRYAPNVAAVRRLARLWPEVQRRRTGTTALIAGAAPVAEVVRLCAMHGWTLLADFDEVAAVYGRGRVAVAPLEHTAGIQIKLLDAAMLGVAQVVSPAALEGLAPGFPVSVAASDDGFVDALLAMLDDGDHRARQAAAAAEHVREHYSAVVWAPVVAELVGIARGAG